MSEKSCNNNNNSDNPLTSFRTDEGKNIFAQKKQICNIIVVRTKFINVFTPIILLVNVFFSELFQATVYYRKGPLLTASKHNDSNGIILFESIFPSTILIQFGYSMAYKQAASDVICRYRNVSVAVFDVTDSSFLTNKCHHSSTHIVNNYIWGTSLNILDNKDAQDTCPNKKALTRKKEIVSLSLSSC